MKIKPQIRLLGQLYNLTVDQLGLQLDDQLRDQVREKLGVQIKRQLWDRLWYRLRQLKKER